MKKILHTLAASLCAMVIPSAVASILPYNDFRDINLIDAILNSESPSLSGSFTIAHDDGDSFNYDIYGFDSTKHVVTKAAAAFSFYQDTDHGRKWAQVDVDFGDIADLGRQIELGQGIPGSLFEFNYVFDSEELTDDLRVMFLADIQLDGVLEWTIALDLGDDQICETDIHVYAGVLGVEVVEVPDSAASATLLGVGLFVVLGFRRRLH